MCCADSDIAALIWLQLLSTMPDSNVGSVPIPDIIRRLETDAWAILPPDAFIENCGLHAQFTACMHVVHKFVGG